MVVTSTFIHLPLLVESQSDFEKQRGACSVREASLHKVPDLDWMCSRLLSAVLSHASVMFSISERSRSSSSLFRGLRRPDRNQEEELSSVHAANNTHTRSE